jgi:hypothetical protein
MRTINEILLDYFTEEEFNNVRDKNGSNYLKKIIKEYQRKGPSYKIRKYPGGELVDDTSRDTQVRDSVMLVKKYNKYADHYYWVVKLDIDKSDCFGDLVPPVETKEGFFKINDWGKEIYLGVGDKFGELKPLSEMEDNKKLKGNIKLNTTFKNVQDLNYIYVKKINDDGKFICEKWSHHSWRSANFAGDAHLTEEQILNMYIPVDNSVLFNYFQKELVEQ